MSVVYVLVPLALLIVAVALGAFIHSVRKGQFDDLDTPAHRMLIDDEFQPAPPTPPESGTRERPGGSSS
ncbi:MAG: cbb3-type cytochrome oxidase assembly protein CcoS [Calditrichaeota bacterium]|nr:cbb3-type cytochrome oxidase assembly protein CcoS [Candidatus Cloacimonadota bacterium]MCB1045703.1 cbb3-type cytochrome oxidase assembly protein CcoS [Calditrichota bacterium]MCB9473600.1 cbb3-type cytochrome oxidase assembly protein CcoS [Candidatus Delongbacteria bacterium]